MAPVPKPKNEARGNVEYTEKTPEDALQGKKASRSIQPAVQRKKTLQRLEKELDILWGKLIHQRWGHKCGWPGCEYPNPRLAAHHWKHKSAGKKARWNLDNGILLCYFHHIHCVHQQGDTEPIRDALIERLGQDGFNALREECSGIWKPTIEELQELKQRFSKELETLEKKP